MQREKLAYKWQQNNQANKAQKSIDQIVDWVQEAVQIGCWKDSEVESYLKIRSQYPTKPLPENIASHAIKQKLAEIEYYFQAMA